LDLFLAISQGVGVSLATGVRTFLPPLLVGVLARADAGVDFDGTSYHFLESVPWLLVLVGLVALIVLADRASVVVPALALAVAAAAIGALEFAGSLADEGFASGPGLVAGAACALVAFVAARAFFGRSVARVREGERAQATTFIELYAEGVALAVAALAVLVPPASYLALAACGWMLLAQRRRAAAKYEGLRVLR
jgi:hypothetical protein